METDKHLAQDHAKEAFKEIWTAHPELQNWSSSAWWFFVFLPKQEKGYGPKQMMFTYASRKGKLNKVNNTWQKGFRLNREKSKQDKFMTTVVGWIKDDHGVHEEIVHVPALAILDRDKRSLNAWDDDNKYGAEIKASEEKEIAIDGNFVGKNGHAKFTIWSDLEDIFDLPTISDFRGPSDGNFGGTHLVAWRKFKFEGEFKSPKSTEQLTGIGYFQRVLMNIPMQPWKWTYMAFEDGSIYSSFMLYFGLHNFRRDYYFYKQRFERFVVDVISSAYYYDAKEGKVHTFSSARTVPEIKSKNGMPNFYMEAKNRNGDFIRMKTKTHGHAQFLLDRRILNYFWQTKFNYNEYMYEIVKMKARIEGEKVDLIKKHGRLWGNIEYVFGWSL